jgi:hypothetical protein
VPRLFHFNHQEIVMARVITSSEIDRLHCQVAELQRQVKELIAFVYAVRDQLLLPNPAQTPARPGELFELSDADIVAGLEPAASSEPPGTVEEFEPLYDYNKTDVISAVRADGYASEADAVLESLTGTSRLPSDEAGASEQDGDFLQP